ncbi:hypothetical protein CI238_12209, partial [Colletotrichum incanum]
LSCVRLRPGCWRGEAQGCGACGGEKEESHHGQFSYHSPHHNHAKLLRMAAQDCGGSCSGAWLSRREGARGGGCEGTNRNGSDRGRDLSWLRRTVLTTGYIRLFPPALSAFIPFPSILPIIPTVESIFNHLSIISTFSTTNPNQLSQYAFHRCHRLCPRLPGCCPGDHSHCHYPCHPRRL